MIKNYIEKANFEDTGFSYAFGAKTIENSLERPKWEYRIEMKEMNVNNEKADE